MGKVDELEPDRALELLDLASLEGGKVIDKQQTARIQMVTSLTAKELHKLLQFLQENVGNQNRLLGVESDEVGEHVVNVFAAQASTKSFVQPLHPLLVVTDDSKHAETKGDLEEPIKLLPCSDMDTLVPWYFASSCFFLASEASGP